MQLQARPQVYAMPPFGNFQFSPRRFARVNSKVAYDPRGTITDVPGAGLLPSSAPNIPMFMQPQSWPTYRAYKCGQAGPALGGLGVNPLIDAARYEVTSEVEHKVIEIFESYVMPIVIGSTVLSVFAFGFALAAYRGT